MTIYRLSTRALRLEERRVALETVIDVETKEAVTKLAPTGTWFLTLSTNPPVSIDLGTERPELPLTLHIEVTK